MKNLLLVLILPFISLAANQRDIYRTCLDASNKLESPADRDAEKINCFNKTYQKKETEKKSIGVCLKLARVLEHTSSSDMLVINCINDNIFKMTLDECIGTAKKLYYSDNRDKALWSCLEDQPVKRSRCKSIADEMTFPHNRNVALNFCLGRN